GRPGRTGPGAAGRRRIPPSRRGRWRRRTPPCAGRSANWRRSARSSGGPRGTRPGRRAGERRRGQAGPTARRKGKDHVVDVLDSSQRWVRRFHPAPDGEVTVVCFPHAGGSAGYFAPLSARLTPRAEVLALQYPGRQDRRFEPALTSVGELVEGIVEALSGHTGRPLVFFGHSMGATLAFETARRLEPELGGRLLGLVVSGRRSPGTVRRETVHLRDDAGLIAEVRG